MRTSCCVAWVLALAGAAAGAQETAPVYQTERPFGFRADALVRQEWLREVFLAPGSFENQDRRRFQFRPRLEFGQGPVRLGVGGEFNFSSDENTRPPAGQSSLALLRDNYDSRGARLDLAFARLEPLKGVVLEGGRFEMPVALTEMIWDKDLRPQGAALTLGSAGDATGARFGLTGLWARGSHVFDDDETDMLLGSASLVLPSGSGGRFELVGSYLEWRRLDRLEPMIRRQNTRVAGLIVRDYRVLDAVARLQAGGQVPWQLLADVCWNTAAPDQKRGLWLAASLGSLQTSVLRADYTYAKVDRDATVAAYAGDDFFWGTGWEGHRADLGTAVARRTSLHLVGQLQRFKDSPRPEERDHWLKRLRIELRSTY